MKTYACIIRPKFFPDNYELGLPRFWIPLGHVGHVGGHRSDQVRFNSRPRLQDTQGPVRVVTP